MTSTARALDALADWTGHRFVDVDVALRALTHGSYAHEHPEAGDYERLEFLGDGAVNLHAALMLARRFPDADNAGLTDMRQRVVETMALGRQGVAMGIDAQIRWGRGVADDPHTRTRITGDVVEAIFGALLAEAGFEATRPFAERALGPLVARIDPAAPAKKAVNRLQEYSQARDGVLPEYDVRPLGEVEHDPQFEATVSLDGAVLARGIGRSKKESRERAAHAALALIARQEP